MGKYRRLLAIVHIQENQKDNAIRKIMEILEYKVQRFFKRWIWFFSRPLFSIIARSTNFLAPINVSCKKVFFLKCDASDLKFIPVSKNQTAAQLKAINLLLCKPELITITNIDLAHKSKNALLVITHEYNVNVLRNMKLIEFVKFVHKIRRLQIPVWIFPADGASLDYLIRNSIIVSFCGGAIICQTNTRKQMDKFGVPHAYGPFIWTTEFPLQEAEFYVQSGKSGRENLCVIAGSGGGKLRQVLGDEVRKYFMSTNAMRCVITEQKLPWNEYVMLIKNSLVTVTTSALQDCHTQGMWMFGRKLPQTTFTDRVLEGLVSGSAVVTTSDECLDFMNLVPGQDYIKVENIDQIDDVLGSYSSEDYLRIGANGQKKLESFLIRQFAIE